MKLRVGIDPRDADFKGKFSGLRLVISHARDETLKRPIRLAITEVVLPNPGDWPDGSFSTAAGQARCHFFVGANGEVGRETAVEIIRISSDQLGFLCCGRGNWGRRDWYDRKTFPRIKTILAGMQAIVQEDLTTAQVRAWLKHQSLPY